MTPMTDPRARDPFYLWVAVAMMCTVSLGFSFTYFGPLFRGAYPDVPAIVHVHGWSFFAWYLLLIVQAGLVRSGRVTIHRTLGLASTALAAVMIGVGLIVATVRVDMALGDPDPFWSFMALPIFSIWVLFTALYAAAIHRRRHPSIHKRLMLLAAAAPLGAATFRILTRFVAYSRWVAVIGTLAPIVFVFAAMIHDHRRMRRVSPIYLSGAAAILGVVGGTFLLVVTPGWDVANQGVAWLGRLLRPLY